MSEYGLLTDQPLEPDGVLIDPLGRPYPPGHWEMTHSDPLGLEETVSGTTSSAPAPAGMVLTSFSAAGRPRYVPLWAVKHPGMDTSKYGIGGTAEAPPPTASSHDMTIRIPMYDELCDVIHEHGGSLGDEGCEQYEELQVGAVNELILCSRTDKVDLLLQLLDVEGVELRASGEQPPPLLVLAKLEKAFHFPCMTRVWQKLIVQGADPAKKYGDESAIAVAREMASPVLF